MVTENSIMDRYSTGVLVSLSLVLGGCGAQFVRQRAAFDFDCPESNIEVVDAGEAPMEWKPSVCWQLPIKVDWEPGSGDTEVATVRRWSRPRTPMRT